MGGVNCIQTFFGFLDFFYIYKVPKQCKNNKYWFSLQNLNVYFFQLGTTFHGMGQYRIHRAIIVDIAENWLDIG